jgi:hypothetical protein
MSRNISACEGRHPVVLETTADIAPPIYRLARRKKQTPMFTPERSLSDGAPDTGTSGASLKANNLCHLKNKSLLIT